MTPLEQNYPKYRVTIELLDSGKKVKETDIVFFSSQEISFYGNKAYKQICKGLEKYFYMLEKL